MAICRGCLTACLVLRQSAPFVRKSWLRGEMVGWVGEGRTSVWSIETGTTWSCMHAPTARAIFVNIGLRNRGTTKWNHRRKKRMRRISLEGADIFRGSWGFNSHAPNNFRTNTMSRPYIFILYLYMAEQLDSYYKFCEHYAKTWKIEWIVTDYYHLPVIALGWIINQSIKIYIAPLQDTLAIVLSLRPDRKSVSALRLLYSDSVLIELRRFGNIFVIGCRNHDRKSDDKSRRNHGC